MNPLSKREISLYQLIQEMETPPPTLSFTLTTIKSLLQAFIDVLVEEQIQATLWLKLPSQLGWLEEIERYQKQGKPEQIYLCSHKENRFASSSHGNNNNNNCPASSPLTPVLLENNSYLKGEYFFIVLSPQLSSLILVEDRDNFLCTEIAKNAWQSLNWSAICSFELPVIRKILSSIQQTIAITDTTPEKLLVNSVDSIVDFSLLSPASPKLITELWLKQIQYNQVISSSDNPSFITGSGSNKITDYLEFKEDFLHNLAWQMRLPLTNMKTALILLESKQSKREQRGKYLELLQRQWDCQNSLLTGLLEFLEFDRTLESTPESSVKLEDLIPGLVSIYQPIAREKDIQLGYLVPAGFPSVYCPSYWLKQIILNLLSNSLKFTPSQGRIFVKVSLKDEFIELTVTDTGIGIESSNLPKIFDNFYRGKNEMNDEAAAGLGLTIVQYLVNRCGGSISVSSQLGKGSTFKILLPVVKS